MVLTKQWSVSSEACDGQADSSSIIHTASPFHWNVTKPEDFIVPAVAGTRSILQAASKEGVGRLVLTSSYAS